MRYYYSELSITSGSLSKDRQSQLHDLLSQAIATLGKIQEFDENNGREVNHPYNEIEDTIKDIACALGYQCTLYKVPF